MCVCGRSVVARSPFYIAVAIGLSGRSAERLCASVQSAEAKCFLWHGADRSRLNPTVEEGGLEVKITSVSPHPSTRCQRACFSHTFRRLINPSVIAQQQVTDTDTFHQLSLPQASAIPRCPRSLAICSAPFQWQQVEALDNNAQKRFVSLRNLLTTSCGSVLF